MPAAYLNPVEALGLGSTPPDEIDAATIRRAKKGLLQELELADNGELTHHGQRLDKSAIELAVQALTDNPDHLRAWHRLANAPALTAFLVSGDAQHLTSLPRPLTTDPALPTLIGPRYAEQLDRALLAAYQANDAAAVRALVAAPALYLPEERGRAFRGVMRVVKEQTDEIKRLKEKLDEDDDAKHELQRAVLCWNAAKPALLGLLPDDVAGSLKTALAQATRNYTVDHFNTFSDAAAVIPLAKAAAGLPSDALTRDKLRADVAQIEEIGRQQKERERREAITAQFSEVFEKLLTYPQQIEKNQVTPRVVRLWAEKLDADIKRINQLGEDAEEPRQMLAIGLRNLSVAIWNKKDDGEAALAVLERALAVQVDVDTNRNLRDARRQLSEAVKAQTDRNRIHTELGALVELIQQVEHRRISASSVQQRISSLYTFMEWLNSRGDESSEARDTAAMALRGLAVSLWNHGNDGETAKLALERAKMIQVSYTVRQNLRSVEADLTEAMKPKGLFGWIKKMLSCAVPLLVAASLVSCDDSSRQYRETSPPVPPTTIADSATYEPPASPYAGNQLSNGASPLDNCFGKGKYSGPAWVKFKNGNGTDAIVCLVDNRTEKTIRNEYIQAGSEFKMSRIPRGIYYLKVFHGRDWNPTRRSACGTAGYFDSSQSFSESRGASDLLEISSDVSGYTTGEITLYTVANGNMQQSPMNAEDFFQ